MAEFVIFPCFTDPHDAAIRNGAIYGHHLLLAGFSQGLAGFWLGASTARRSTVSSTSPSGGW